MQDDIITPIKKELIKTEEIIQNSIYSNFDVINKMSDYVLASSGKKIRPILLLLSAALFNNINNKAIKSAACVEMLHLATLIHDDVIDNSNLRRNKPSLNFKFGNLNAIIFGDYIYCQVFKIIAKLKDEFIAKSILEAADFMCKGELLQNLNAFNPNILMKDYINIIKNKTAIFFSKCSAIGAHCTCKNSTDKIKNMLNFGLNVGIAFQIIDDVFDLTTKENVIGKPIGKDITEGKVTLPIILLLKSLNDKLKNKIINNILNKKINIEFINRLIKLCNDFNTINKSILIANNFINKALFYLEKVDGDKKIKENLNKFCSFILNRKF